MKVSGVCRLYTHTENNSFHTRGRGFGVLTYLKQPLWLKTVSKWIKKDRDSVRLKKNLAYLQKLDSAFVQILLYAE